MPKNKTQKNPHEPTSPRKRTHASHLPPTYYTNPVSGKKTPIPTNIYTRNLVGTATRTIHDKVFEEPLAPPRNRFLPSKSHIGLNKITEEFATGYRHAVKSKKNAVDIKAILDQQLEEYKTISYSKSVEKERKKKEKEIATQTRKITEKEREIAIMEAMIKATVDKHKNVFDIIKTQPGLENVDISKNIGYQLEALKQMREAAITEYDKKQQEAFETERKDGRLLAIQKGKLEALVNLQKKYATETNPATLTKLKEDIKKLRKEIQQETSRLLTEKPILYEDLTGMRNKGFGNSIANTWSTHKDVNKAREMNPKEAAELVSRLRDPNRDPTKKTRNTFNTRGIRYLESFVSGRALPTNKELEEQKKFTKLVSNIGNEQLLLINDIERQIQEGTLTHEKLRKLVKDLGRIGTGTLSGIYNSDKKTILNVLSKKLDQKILSAILGTGTQTQIPVSSVDTQAQLRENLEEESAYAVLEGDAFHKTLSGDYGDTTLYSTLGPRPAVSDSQSQTTPVSVAQPNVSTNSSGDIQETIIPETANTPPPPRPIAKKPNL